MATYRTVVSPPVSSSNCAFPCFMLSSIRFGQLPATSPTSPPFLHGVSAPWMTCCWAPWGHPGGESGRAGTSRRQWPSPWPEAYNNHDHNDEATTTTARPHVFFSCHQESWSYSHTQKISQVFGAWLAFIMSTSLLLCCGTQVPWWHKHFLQHYGFCSVAVPALRNRNTPIYLPQESKWLFLDFLEDLTHKMKGRPRIGRWAYKPRHCSWLFLRTIPNQLSQTNASAQCTASKPLLLLGFHRKFHRQNRFIFNVPNITQVPWDALNCPDQHLHSPSLLTKETTWVWRV